MGARAPPRPAHGSRPQAWARRETASELSQGEDIDERFVAKLETSADAS